MADYGKLLSRIWSDEYFVALDARPQQLYCLLISYSTRNLAGVLPLTMKRWSNCTGDATIDNLTQALIVLAANSFVVVDWDTEELLIRTFIRNDEVYRQPNLMKSARKFALQVESEALRWALHDELERLPDHKDQNQTEDVAKMLVKGLTRTPTKGFGEGFGEGLPEPPGVGVSSVGKENTSTYTDHRAPTPAAAAIPEPLDAIAATSGADLVRRIIPSEHPAAVQTALRLRASELINTGTPQPIVDAALRLWLTKPNLGPHTLPSLVSEVLKTQLRGAPNGIGKSSQKALEYRQLGRELIEEIHGDTQP
jgi:hypothetical protein